MGEEVGVCIEGENGAVGAAELIGVVGEGEEDVTVIGKGIETVVGEVGELVDDGKRVGCRNLSSLKITSLEM
jgi:hypothetical protein